MCLFWAAVLVIEYKIYYFFQSAPLKNMESAPAYTFDAPRKCERNKKDNRE